MGKAGRMGRFQNAAVVAAGAALMASMVPNLRAGELSPAGACLMLLGFGVCLLPALLWVVRLNSQKLYRILRALALSVFAVCAVGIGALLAVMLPAARSDAGHIPAGTAVVVPGCLLRGGEPGDMLRGRLDAALAYLRADPTARCVVTGGYYGAYTQAAVEKAYLVSRGVDSARILVDGRSATTYQNLRNAKALLGGAKAVAIATDGYHQYRSQFYARELSLRPYALTSQTPARHIPDSWAREFLAVLKARATGV